MLGLAPISAVPVSALDTHSYIVVPNPAGSYGKSKDSRKAYIIDGEKIYLNTAELQQVLDGMQKEKPVVEVVAEAKVDETASAYRAKENSLAEFIAQQARLASEQAETQKRLAAQAAAEQEVLVRWMEDRRRDEEEALLVLL
jgi:hypothetical protein